MPLYNASKKARNATSIVNQSQGGGSKKAGFPYQVGRSTATSVAFNMTNPVDGACAKLSCLSTTLYEMKNYSRPVGSTVSANYRRYNMF
jgi:hypothetical protein